MHLFGDRQGTYDIGMPACEADSVPTDVFTEKIMFRIPVNYIPKHQ